MPSSPTPAREAVETALKIAIAYQRAIGQGTRTRLIGRERGYHGVNFGGISVGGIVINRKFFGTLLTGVDHLPHTHLPARNAFSKGQPEHGAELADELERIVTLHDASTIAAVIVEPVAGSTGRAGAAEGVSRAAARDLHEARDPADLRRGDHRVRADRARRSRRRSTGCMPDMITCAKGLTNGVIPMGAVLTTAAIHDAFMTGPEHLIELFHGYTYSGNPIAAAAGLATLEIYAEEGLFERAAALAPVWEEALHSLRDCPHVIDIRNEGLIGAVELEPIAGRADASGRSRRSSTPTTPGILIRTTGDIIALSPPLIISEAQIDELIGRLRRVLQKLA